MLIRNPDVGKWAGSRNFLSNSSGEYVCRPLACPAPSKVTVRISNSPTRSPDRQALAKYASTLFARPSFRSSLSDTEIEMRAG